MQCGVAGVYTTLNISVIASDPGDIAALNVPVASTIVKDSAMADVTSAIGIAWAPVPAAPVVLTAVHVPKVPAVARVSDVAATSLLLLLLTSLLLLMSLLWLTSLC